MENTDNHVNFTIDDTVYQTNLTRKYARRKSYVPVNPKKIIAFIPGVIFEIFVQPNQEVKKGDKLLVLEAMKMKNILTSQSDGTIKTINVSPGQKVLKHELLLEFE